MKTFLLLTFGVLVHIIFLFSIFDIYFKSTVIVGISPINNSILPHGKRVVVISVDGLRVDSLFDKNKNEIKNLMPYMQRIIQEKGTWGISESHVPTESRPGHVAMLAGFYEDPSAVTRGWKENPVSFDSVFNQSYCSFAWGSPDVLSIFFKGLNKNCAFSYSYQNEQNFAGDTMEYDNWVVSELKMFFEKSRNNSMLYGKGILFFLHLLGQDTSGHTHKPHTYKYIQNTKNVDRIVKDIEMLFNKFYSDNLTSFILTSDHGMTDWGSHGAGHPNETDTPFVAWGAGINNPVGDYKMFNINQADITPLLSILLGSPIPVNSMGTLPVEYLNMSLAYKAEAMLLNAKQITLQFQTSLRKVKSQIISFFHSPFEKLTNEELHMMISSISDQIKNKRYKNAIEKSKVLIQIGLEGLEYYQNYYQRLLLISVSASYILWILYLTLELFDKSKTSLNSFSTSVFLLVAFITFVFIFFQKLPLSFTLYFLLPELLLLLIISKIKKSHYSMVKKNKLSLLSCLLTVLICVEIIVLSFFQRWLLCANLIIALIWSLFTLNLKKCNKTIVSLWVITGIILSIFCLLPIVGGQPNILLIVISGFIVFALLLLMFLYDIHKENLLIFCVRCIPVALSAWNSAVVHVNFNEDGQLPKFNQILTWCLCLFSLLLLLLGKSFILLRFHQVFISFLVPFLLLSISYEGLFIASLFIHLRCWLHIECENKGIEAPDFGKLEDSERLSFNVFRIAYFFLLYVWVGFFGLGNIASLNSFDPAWVRCFLTLFSPFLMTSLILFKTAIPFLIVTCSLRVLTVLLKLRSDQMFIVVLIYCNMMGLNFLYFIKNRGSWLDIGSSISHYVIQQITVVFLVILYGISKFLLSFSHDISLWLNKFRRDINYHKNIRDSTDNLMSLPRYYSSNKLHRS